MTFERPSAIDGDKVKKEYFNHHRLTTARLNHGSFGACPAPVLRVQEEFRSKWLAQPDEFYYFGIESTFNRNCEAIAKLVNCPPKNISIVENATTGAVVVAQRLQWQFIEGVYEKGKDAVLVLNFIYGAVRKIVAEYCERAGARVVTVNIPFPIAGPEEVIEALADVLDAEQGRVKLAILDHITSMPGLVLPIKQMVALCHERGVPEVFVDGAHAIGNVDVDVTDIGAEYYVSNMHKWMFCPSGIALFYCKDSVAASIHHPIISHNYKTGFRRECAWVGTLDRSPYYCAEAAIRFYEEMGGRQGVTQYNHDKVVEMAHMLAEAWGTELGAPASMAGSMAMVALPPVFEYENSLAAEKLRHHLRDKYDVEVAIYANGRSYIRLSHQIYNTRRDYERLRDAVLEVARQGKV